MQNNEKQVLKLLTFENRLRDEVAHYISYTDGFLWRRDLARIVALRVPNQTMKHMDYSIRDILSKQPILGFELDEQMLLHVMTASGEVTVSPMERTKPHSLKYALRKEQVFQIEGKMDVKALKQVLFICEQKWMLEKEEDPNIVFDFENGCILMKNREEKFNMPFEKGKAEKMPIIIYAFHLLKDMVYNKEKHIFFRISEDYTVLEYGNQLYGVLMHVSKEEEYPPPLRN